MWRSAPCNSLPFTRMWSRSGSALLPSSVTICPLTDTTPELISSSALRRDAIPAAAMIFCKRSAGMYGKDYQRVYATFLCATPLWNSVSSVVYFCLILAVKMEEQAVVQGRNHFDDRWREVELMPFSQFGPESYPNVVLLLPFRPPALVSRLPPPPAANRFGTTPPPAFRILPCSAAR